MIKPSETEQLDTKYQVLINSLNGHQRPGANDAKTVCAYNYIAGVYALLQLSGAVRADSVPVQFIFPLSLIATISAVSSMFLKAYEVPVELPA